jgi:hypothetical protein
VPEERINGSGVDNQALEQALAVGEDCQRIPRLNRVGEQGIDRGLLGLPDLPERSRVHGQTDVYRSPPEAAGREQHREQKNSDQPQEPGSGASFDDHLSFHLLGSVYHRVASAVATAFWYNSGGSFGSPYIRGISKVAGTRKAQILVACSPLSPVVMSVVHVPSGLIGVEAGCQYGLLT